jgi:hypothetical protein
MYTAPWHITLLTNYNWEQMANGADNCCLLQTSHKKSSIHELHYSPRNIMPSSGPQVDSLPSFQTLSSTTHGDSSTKFVCASRQTSHRSPWSAELWTVNKVKRLCRKNIEESSRALISGIIPAFACMDCGRPQRPLSKQSVPRLECQVGLSRTEMI